MTALNRRLVLESRERLPDGAGGFVETWAALGQHWAAIRPGPGREVAGEGAALGRVTLTITLRAAPPGAPSRPVAGQRLREGGRLFSILSVSDSADGRWLSCTATEEVAR